LNIPFLYCALGVYPEALVYLALAFSASPFGIQLALFPPQWFGMEIPLWEFPYSCFGGDSSLGFGWMKQSPN
jgi:hypothetical protein